jgi:hypothetical protein
MDAKGAPVIGTAQGEVNDLLGLVAWAVGPELLLKKFDALVDQESDDPHSLSQADRDLRLSELARDRLTIQRHLACLIWSAQSAGDSIEHAADADPCAVLGVVETR